jgi:hypothetical protein
MQKLRERQLYLQALHIDQTAPTPPPTVIDNGMYYERLQNLAFLSEQGRYDDVEKVLKNQEIVDEKNIYLQPLYRQLKAWIRYISKTEEAEIKRKYKQRIAGILSSNSELKEQQIEALSVEFHDEINAMKERDAQPSAMLKKIERHVTSLFHLLLVWVHYTEVIYAHENVLKELRIYRVNDNLNVEKDEDNDDIEEHYQTVEEAVTTDTAESAEEETADKDEEGTIFILAEFNFHR